MAFEARVADAFLAKRIHAPIHLSGGNESQLIEIFRSIRPQDWVFSTHRSHYHALLKGIPEDDMFQMILDGRSMFICSREHRFLSSAIVGGALPIALGVALAIKRHGDDARCWCFVGDMAARTGIYHESRQFCIGHNLPVKIVIEDDGFSTDTPTAAAWGLDYESLPPTKYRYDRRWPHVGCGSHVQF